MEEEQVFKKICVDCRNLFATKNMKTRLCQECVKRHREENIARHRQWRAERLKQGICGYTKRCKNPVSPGHTVCEVHLKFMRQRNNERKAMEEEMKEAMRKVEPLVLYPTLDEAQEENTLPILGSSKVKELQPLFKKLDAIDEQIRVLSSEREEVLHAIDELVK